MTNNREELAARFARVMNDSGHRERLRDILHENLPTFRTLVRYLLNYGVRLQLIDFLYEYWTNADTLVNELVEKIGPIATASDEEALDLIILYSAGLDILVYRIEDLPHLFPQEVIPAPDVTDAAEDLLHYLLNKESGQSNVLASLLNHTID